MPTLHTVEEWQRRQREEKEKERRQKQASAEILSGYRASELSADDVKLKALREEERRRKQEAEQTLRNFKKLEEPGIKTRAATAQRQSSNIPLPVNAGGGAGDDSADIAFGSVSAIKANFDDTFSRNGTINNNQMNASTSGLVESQPESLENEAVTALATAATQSNEMDAFTVGTSAPDATDTTNLATTNNSFGVDTSAGSNAVAAKENGFASSPPYSMTVEDRGNILTSLEASVAPTSTLVSFTFGVITDHATEDGTWVSAYRNALVKVLGAPVGVTLDDVELSSCVRDESFMDPRPMVKRFIITARVRVKSTQQYQEPQIIRTTVWDVVREAIQNGQLSDRYA